MFLTNAASSLLDVLRAEDKATISGRAIGEITFDVVKSESHTSTLQITSNPIEDGSIIADHAVLEPKEISVVGVVVDYDPKKVEGGKGKNGGIVREVIDFLEKIPPLAPILNKSKGTILKIEEVLSTFSALFSNNVRPIAPWLPDYTVSSIIDCFPPMKKQEEPQNRVAQAYADLLSVQKSGELITVNTGLHQYKNMMITSISLPQDMDGSGEFTVSLKEIFIVYTEIIDGLVVQKKPSQPSGKKRSKKAEKQGGSKKTCGETIPKPVDNRTELRKLMDWLGVGRRRKK